tara:strand:+ start:1544 stop:2119 length:576 start_codon:yes stop_codon:yes gene_type:complete
LIENKYLVATIFVIGLSGCAKAPLISPELTSVDSSSAVRVDLLSSFRPRLNTIDSLWIHTIGGLDVKGEWSVILPAGEYEIVYDCLRQYGSGTIAKKQALHTTDRVTTVFFEAGKNYGLRMAPDYPESYRRKSGIVTSNVVTGEIKEHYETIRPHAQSCVVKSVSCPNHQKVDTVSASRTLVERTVCVDKG